MTDAGASHAANRSDRPGRSALTYLGLVVLLFAALCYAAILMAQLISTGSPARGSGFVAGRYFGPPMLYGAAAGLVLLLVGGVIDSVRYDRCRKARQSPVVPPNERAADTLPSRAETRAG